MRNLMKHLCKSHVQINGYYLIKKLVKSLSILILKENVFLNYDCQLNNKNVDTLIIIIIVIKLFFLQSYEEIIKTYIYMY